jgi:hypothetical protein
MSCGERRNSVPVEKSPKEKKYVSNITYFGKPVYTYSLKQEIEDGFLVRFGLWLTEFEEAQEEDSSDTRPSPTLH